MWEAHHALRMLAEFPIVPFRLKQPLIAAFFYQKLVCGRKRVLAVMNGPAYAESKVKVHAIAMSKKLGQPLRPKRSLQSLGVPMKSSPAAAATQRRGIV